MKLLLSFIFATHCQALEIKDHKKKPIKKAEIKDEWEVDCLQSFLECEANKGRKCRKQFDNCRLNNFDEL